MHPCMHNNIRYMHMHARICMGAWMHIHIHTSWPDYPNTCTVPAMDERMRKMRARAHTHAHVCLQFWGAIAETSAHLHSFRGLPALWRRGSRGRHRQRRTWRLFSCRQETRDSKTGVRWCWYRALPCCSVRRLHPECHIMRQWSRNFPRKPAFGPHGVRRDRQLPSLADSPVLSCRAQRTTARPRRHRSADHERGPQPIRS